MNRFTSILAILAILLPAVLTGCGKADVPETEVTAIPLTFSVGGLSTGVETKMSEKVVQIDNPRTFRGIQRFYILPFAVDKSREYVKADDVCIEDNIPLSKYDFFDNIQYSGNSMKGYLYKAAYVYNKTNALLVYGQSNDETSSTMTAGSLAAKQYNGVIVETGAASRVGDKKAAQICFDLESIVSGQAEAYETWRTANLAMLNAIAAKASVLPETFKLLSREGGIFTCSQEPIVLTQLYRACANLAATAGDPEKTQAQDVCDKIAEYTQGSNPFLAISGSGETAVVTMPRSAFAEFGMPDGAIALHWSSSSNFATADKSEGFNLAAVEDYCFPPALWYMSNSALYGTEDASVVNYFVEGGKWSDPSDPANSIVDKYTIRGVNNFTKAAVIKTPLQYAVALLKLNINKSASTLKDNSATPVNVDVANDKFPLTGILIGGQRTQDFNFSATDKNMRFVYDMEVNAADGSPLAWISSTQSSTSLYTLAFETRPNEDINFALEFRNDSGFSFTGARGCTILPGSKFYLIGTMVYSEGTPAGSDTPASVFTKDRITTLTVKFGALEASYAALPELTSPDLQMGVSAKLSWSAVKPISIPISE